jgi:uncharacterized GH25 family protein
MRRKLMFLFLLPACAVLPAVYEVWLLPEKFLYQPGEKAAITIRTGNDFGEESVDIKKDRIEKATHYYLAVSKDLKPVIKEGPKDQLEVTLDREGTHLVTLQSTAAANEVDAEEFNTYLKDNGLDEVYDQRTKTNTLNTSGRELHTWYSKLLLQSGAKRDGTSAKVAGFPLEIMPEKNPYAVKAGEVIRFKILWQGKPLFGAKVKVWINKDNRTGVQNIYTGQDGMIETRMSSNGTWMVSVVKMVPSKNAQADWQRYGSSLVFGIQ